MQAPTASASLSRTLPAKVATSGTTRDATPALAQCPTSCRECGTRCRVTVTRPHLPYACPAPALCGAGGRWMSGATGRTPTTQQRRCDRGVRWWSKEERGGWACVSGCGCGRHKAPTIGQRGPAGGYMTAAKCAIRSNPEHQQGGMQPTATLLRCRACPHTGAAVHLAWHATVAWRAGHALPPDPLPMNVSPHTWPPPARLLQPAPQA